MKHESNSAVPDKDKICSVNESGDEHRLEYLKDMVRQSEYVCSECGRAASVKDAVCRPESLRDGSGSDSSSGKIRVSLDDLDIPDYEKACFVNDYDSSLRMELLKRMAEDARFVCSACGRAASRKIDVCSPEKL
jgi:predicted RNA-binding Zn-ribbon protein involved in translation (DUF1610 family)